jgi:hypothetical protein
LTLSFSRARPATKPGGIMKFLAGRADDLRKNLLARLRVVWTPTSAVLADNPLTLYWEVL